MSEHQPDVRVVQAQRDVHHEKRDQNGDRRGHPSGQNQEGEIRRAAEPITGGTYAAGLQLRERSLRIFRDPARGGRIRADILRPGPPLLRFVHPAVQRSDIAPTVPPLLPSRHAGAAASPRRLPKQTAD